MSKCSCNKREYFPAKVKAKVNGFERTISFKTGYLCEIPFNQGSSHGRHGMELIFLLNGDEGVVQFVVFTGWEPKYDMGKNAHFMPADIGYHSPKPLYEGQSIMGDCNWLDGKPCYYDGSGLHAEEVFKVFVSKGEEAMWGEMEAFYNSHFVQSA